MLTKVAILKFQESDGLISYMISPDHDRHNIDDLISVTSDQDLISTSSDWTGTSQYDAESSGYESRLILQCLSGDPEKFCFYILKRENEHNFLVI